MQVGDRVITAKPGWFGPNNQTSATKAIGTIVGIAYKVKFDTDQDDPWGYTMGVEELEPYTDPPSLLKAAKSLIEAMTNPKPGTTTFLYSAEREAFENLKAAIAAEETI